jgi:hypothetical protein
MIFDNFFEVLAGQSPFTVSIRQINAKLPILATFLVALAAPCVGRTDAAEATAPAQSATPPALTTPTRSTPLSASQIGATPINGPAIDTSLAGFTGWTKPAWLSDLSLGVKESYDDNVLRVSGMGLPIESSWVNVVSLKLGLNLTRILPVDPGAIQVFSLIYQPDRATYSQASSEDFTAHRVNATLKAKSGNITFSLDDAFLFNDGSKFAPTYALNQLPGAAGNQNDKYRNSLAHAAPRERRNQFQDRYTAFLQYDTRYLFFRPISALNLIDMKTYLFNTSLAPYEGYQDYVERYDVNVGADMGLKVTPNWAITLGYRDGYQYQQQYALAINSDQHFSSNHYQRLLFGLEGKLDWLNVKLAAGPDFRDFNPDTPISDLHTTRFYGEAAVIANLSHNQSLTLNYKDYIFVSSTGLVPYEEYTYSLLYHLSATRQLGIDLGAKLFEHNYTLGDDLAGSAPSMREDLDEEGLAGVTFAFTPHLIASLTYNFDDGRNALGTLAAKYAPAYRNFEEGVFAGGVQYRF